MTVNNFPEAVDKQKESTCIRCINAYEKFEKYKWSTEYVNDELIVLPIFLPRRNFIVTRIRDFFFSPTLLFLSTFIELPCDVIKFKRLTISNRTI